MKHTDEQHTSPCHDCPWRRKSGPGWLGSDNTPEDWTRLAHGEAFIECHGIAESETSEAFQCAGVAIFRANVAKSCRRNDVLRLPADRERVFSSSLEFIKHHRSIGVVSSELGLPKTTE